MDILAQYRAHPVPKELAFPAAEYGERLARVRRAMAEQGLDLLLLHHLPSVCYLTGYQTPVSDWYNCLIVPPAGPLTLQVCDFEVGLALAHTTLERIVSVRWNRMDEASAQLVDLLREVRLDGRRIGIETRRTGLNAHTYRLLREAFPGADLVDVS